LPKGIAPTIAQWASKAVGPRALRPIANFSAEAVEKTR